MRKNERRHVEMRARIPAAARCPRPPAGALCSESDPLVPGKLCATQLGDRTRRQQCEFVSLYE